MRYLKTLQEAPAIADRGFRLRKGSLYPSCRITQNGNSTYEGLAASSGLTRSRSSLEGLK